MSVESRVEVLQSLTIVRRPRLSGPGKFIVTSQTEFFLACRFHGVSIKKCSIASSMCGRKVQVTILRFIEARTGGGQAEIPSRTGYTLFLSIANFIWHHLL